MQDSAELDEVDLALVNALQLQPRAPWALVGDVLGINPVTAARRWARLESEGLAWISAYPPITPHQANAFVEIACEPGQGLSVAGENGRELNWTAAWDGPAQSIDQRVKMSTWLELFEQRGGKLIIHGVTTADLNSLARLYELVIVAAGKGELVQLFDRDPANSPFTTPQRALSVAYVHGMQLRPEHPWPNVWMNYVPGVCELICIPAYTLSGNCDILYFSAVPGCPADH